MSKSDKSEKSNVSKALEKELQSIMKLQGNISEKKQIELLHLLRGWKNPQRRQDERKACITSVDFTVEGRLFTGSILDISTGGACISSDEKFDRGQAIVLTFQVPDSNAPIKASGEIAWVKEDSFGVTFETVSDYLFEYLGKALESL